MLEELKAESSDLFQARMELKKVGIPVGPVAAGENGTVFQQRQRGVVLRCQLLGPLKGPTTRALPLCVPPGLVLIL